MSLQPVHDDGNRRHRCRGSRGDDKESLAVRRDIPGIPCPGYRSQGDGKELFFVAGEERGGPVPHDMMAVAVDTSSTGVFKAGVSQKLFTVETGTGLANGNTWDVTPDGQRFLVSSPSTRTAVPPITVVVNWLQRQATSLR